MGRQSNPSCTFEDAGVNFYYTRVSIMAYGDANDSKYAKFKTQRWKRLVFSHRCLGLCICFGTSIATMVHVFLLQNSVSPVFFDTYSHWKANSEASKALGLLYGIYPTRKNSRCIVMPHFHIPNPNEKFYHTPGFVNCFNRHRCKRKAPSSPFLPGQPSSSGLTVAIYPTNTIEVKLINGKTLKTSSISRRSLKRYVRVPFMLKT